MSGWRLRSSGIAAGAAVSLAVAACGGNARQDVHEKNARYAVTVAAASFPASQSLSQHTHMVIAVRNAGSKTIPDVAVTITDAGYGSTAQPFGERINQPNLASSSRPVWIVDQGPGLNACSAGCGAGGAGGLGGASTAYSNTWALGALAPGRTATFKWNVTAVKQGMHIVHYRIAAGLNGHAIAELAGGAGQPPEGTFRVRIANSPQQAYVNNQGQVVTTP